MNRHLDEILKKPPSRLNFNDWMALKFNGQAKHAYTNRWIHEVCMKNNSPIKNYERSLTNGRKKIVQCCD